MSFEKFPKQETKKNSLKEEKSKEADSLSQEDIFNSKIDNSRNELNILREKLEQADSDSELYALIRETEKLYDEVADLKKEWGLKTSSEKLRDSVIDGLRDSIHNFLMDEVWKKRDKTKKET